jgi:hypothetical protein
LLSASNFFGNEMTFGFASGEASSEFIASAGQTFYAPVTMTLLPGTTMYSLQMNLFVTNFPGSPPVDPATMRFDSFLKYPGTTNGIQVLLPINPAVVYPTTNVIEVTNVVGAVTNITQVTNLVYGLTNGTFTNLIEDLMGVGWIDRYPETNLYPMPSQDLIQYSQAHDITFAGAGDQIELGSFSFQVPKNAASGQTFQIQLGAPSATTYFPPAENPVGVLISTVTNGSLTNGAINSVKTVTVGSARYLVGDAYPFRWFNAGDFGDGVLLNDDVIEVFQSAIYGFNTPPNTSDYYNTMDSSNGTDNNLYDGDDTSINNIAFGDGYLGVDDVYVTFRRSLDPSLTNYDRFWSGGVLHAVAVPTTVSAPKPQTPTPAKPGPKPAVAGSPQYITVAADQVQGAGGSTVQVPVRVLSPSSYPIRVLMLNVDVVPLDGSPAVTNAIGFTGVGNLGLPAFIASQGAANYAAAWLDSTVSGVSGASVIGTLNITLPPNVTSSSAYRIYFEHFSASPNGIALFHTTIQSGLVTLSDRSGSSWNDGIPDAWRLLYFGSVSNALSAANLDPDGDGASNWQEYVAGTNPLDPASVFQLLAGAASSSGFTLQWPSVVNKNYTLQSSPALSSPNWSVVATNLIGTGQIMQWSDSNPSTANFYRAQVH